MHPEIQGLHDVVYWWRTDALEFLRADVPKVLVDLLIAVLLIRLLHALTRRLAAFGQREALPTGMRAQQLRTLASVVNGVGLFTIVFVTAMQVLQAVRINIGPLLASAGVVGLAIGFGAQTLVHDVLNGFFVLMENQYDVGDVVRIANVSGTVERMTLRRTVLRDADGTVHNVPNSQITVVSNLTRDWTQTSVHVAASYHEDTDRIVALLKEVTAELRADPQFHEALVADPQVPGIERVAAGEVDYIILLKTRPGEQYGVVRELRRRIKACFERNHVQPAGPVPLYVLGQAPGEPAK
jgi:small conductance mechanosensitive channel